MGYMRGWLPYFQRFIRQLTPRYGKGYIIFLIRAAASLGVPLLTAGVKVSLLYFRFSIIHIGMRGRIMIFVIYCLSLFLFFFVMYIQYYIYTGSIYTGNFSANRQDREKRDKVIRATCWRIVYFSGIEYKL